MGKGGAFLLDTDSWSISQQKRNGCNSRTNGNGMSLNGFFLSLVSVLFEKERNPIKHSSEYILRGAGNVFRRTFTIALLSTLLRKGERERIGSARERPD